MKKQKSTGRRAQRSSSSRSNIKKGVVACLCVAVALAFAWFLFSARGRALLRRIPILGSISTIFHSAESIPFAHTYGIDVSRYQGDIEWDKVGLICFNIATRKQDPGDRSATVSVDFVFAKATEGANYVDNKYESNRSCVHTLCQEKGKSMLWGAYHVFTLADPAKQAKNFIRNANLVSGDIAPVIDIEEDLVGSKPIATVRKNLEKLVAALRKRYGVAPILYTSQSYSEVLFSSSAFDDCPRWIARYMSLYCPDNADIWQFSESGIVDGVPGVVDMDAIVSSDFRISDHLITK